MMYTLMVSIVGFIGILFWLLLTNMKKQELLIIELSKNAEDHADEILRITESKATREDRLIQQIQNLAQQLATLRIEKGARSEQDRFEQQEDPPAPYSTKLMEFLNGIAYEGSRLLVEEDIERLRALKYDDEHILNIISQA